MYSPNELVGQAAEHHTNGNVLEVGTQFSMAANPAFAPTLDVSTPESKPGLVPITPGQ